MTTTGNAPQGAACWKRTLTLLWGVQFLSGLAMTLGLIFVPFFLVEDAALGVRSESERLLFTSLIFAGPFFTTLVATPFWGWMADRSGRKQQVIRATIGLGLSQVLMGLAQSPLQLVLIRMFQGAVSGVVAANLGLLSAATPPAHQGRAIAWLQTANPAGQILGPVLGGLLAVTLGYRPVYLLLGGLVMLTGVLAGFLVREPEAPLAREAAAENPFAALVRAGRRVARQPRLRTVFSVLFVGQVAWAMAQVVFAIYAGQLMAAWVARQGVAPAWWNTGVGFTSLAATLTGLANVLFLPWWGRSHDRGTPLLSTASAGALSLSMVVLAFWPPWWMVLVARGGVGGALGGIAPLQYAAIGRIVGPEERGRFMGLATSMLHLGNLTGFLLGGVLAQRWGASGNFALSALLYGVVAVVALRLVPAASAADVEVPAAAGR